MPICGGVDAGLTDIDVPIGEIQIGSDGAADPPNNGTRRRGGDQMVDVPETDAFVAFVVEDNDRLNGAILQNHDLRESFRFGRARRHFDLGPQLRVEYDGGSSFTGDAGGENRTAHGTARQLNLPVDDQADTLGVGLKPDVTVQWVELPDPQRLGVGPRRHLDRAASGDAALVLRDARRAFHLETHLEAGV